MDKEELCSYQPHQSISQHPVGVAGSRPSWATASRYSASAPPHRLRTSTSVSRLDGQGFKLGTESEKRCNRSIITYDDSGRQTMALLGLA
jgi:hypothetical protein